jgi:hypothetical protein
MFFFGSARLEVGTKPKIIFPSDLQLRYGALALRLIVLDGGGRGLAIADGVREGVRASTRTYS